MASLGRYLLISAGITAALVAIVVAIYMIRADRNGGQDIARAKQSESGLFSVTMQPEKGQVRMGETQVWLVTVKSKEGQPVENAALHVSGGMPEQNQGLPTSPQATGYLGNGRYRIEGVKFPVPGWWQLRLWIFAAAGTDTVVFNITL
ncbi:FixH family protein [Aquamicrobium ahrensii]|uniref:FixH family protein n=1 Tax=Aquamicrobium ahrensii TaxID=469551 RepID=UPI003398613F